MDRHGDAGTRGRGENECATSECNLVLQLAISYQPKGSPKDENLSLLTPGSWLLAPGSYSQISKLNAEC